MPRMKVFLSQEDGDEDLKSGPCLQVSAGVQLKEQPSTGEEFLLKVINERKNIPALVTYDKYKMTEHLKNQVPNMNQIPASPTVPEKLKPTIEWQNIQVADFSECRMYVSRMRSHPDAKIVPFEYDHCNRGWKIFFTSHKPCLSRVIGLDRDLIDDALDALLQFLHKVKPGDTIKHVTGQWLYTVLTCIKQPIHSRTHSLLRDIARQCAVIGSHIDPEREDAHKLATPLNLFICLVGKYFRQHDLPMEIWKTNSKPMDTTDG